MFKTLALCVVAVAAQSSTPAASQDGYTGTTGTLHYNDGTSDFFTSTPTYTDHTQGSFNQQQQFDNSNYGNGQSTPQNYDYTNYNGQPQNQYQNQYQNQNQNQYQNQYQNQNQMQMQNQAVFRQNAQFDPNQNQFAGGAQNNNNNNFGPQYNGGQNPNQFQSQNGAAWGNRQFDASMGGAQGPNGGTPSPYTQNGPYAGGNNNNYNPGFASAAGYSPNGNQRQFDPNNNYGSGAGGAGGYQSGNPQPFYNSPTASGTPSGPATYSVSNTGSGNFNLHSEQYSFNNGQCYYNDGMLHDNGNTRPLTDAEKQQLTEFNRKMAEYSRQFSMSMNSYFAQLFDFSGSAGGMPTPNGRPLNLPTMPTVPCFCATC